MGLPLFYYFYPFRFLFDGNEYMYVQLLNLRPPLYNLSIESTHREKFWMYVLKTQTKHYVFSLSENFLALFSENPFMNIHHRLSVND